MDSYPNRLHVVIHACVIIVTGAFNHTLHPAFQDHIHIPTEFDSLAPLEE